MKIVVFLSVCILLFGCANQEYTGGHAMRDTHTFERKEFEYEEVTVKIVLLHNKEELVKAAKQFGLHPVTRRSVTSAYITEAWSTYVPGINECTIYIKDPEWRYEPASYGHELSHCIWGRWHDKR